MTRIAIDARMLGDELHGLGRYAYELAAGVARLEPSWEIVLLGGSRWASSLAAACGNVRVEPVLAKPFSAREQVELPRVLGRARPDLFHATSVAIPVMRPVPFVITVPDLIPLVFGGGRLKNRLYFEQYLPAALRGARGVLVFSEAVRRDLHERLGVDPERVAVAPLGVDRRFSPVAEPGEAERLASRYGVERPYVLVTGNVKAHKNLDLGMRAGYAVTRRVEGLRLVMHARGIGAVGPADVIRVGHVDEGDLPALYRGARVLFYPSLYEGFGLPVLEAMACGTPVVSSNATSLPEVVGDAGVLVDAGDFEGCVEALRRVCEDEGMRGDLSRRGVERAAQFTWERTARLTVEVYRAALLPS